ncbi:hypothetical protein ANOM_004123 [Aspergillus nomiae NRRL 13137]|uniref:Uncharacterized protein n=1 Tax=Aspergillus nomiae NRRL (strain ATCC 15546 / NRRL 13137 / CBS 260.88 / M93) TaxID=1509407 RepID=A0A0L1J8B4_ASPN3|nr:uncharacterized protein ANOM_004123 [Aspergillus nomiae NRRL 13137]KNG87663.1 hypothetical protein ANOM_004123 [Aspergillus nomiae NRRL 13137]
MSPITKLWLSTAKTKDYMDSSGFHDLLAQILSHCSSYTNPESNPELPPMHAFFQSVDNPDLLLMVTGYPSQEMNNAADDTYAATFLPRMFQFVEHKWLKQLDVDVSLLPLGNDNLTLQFCDTPVDTATGQVIGGWDVWPETEQGIRMREAGKLEELRKIWVGIGKETGVDLTLAREVFHFRKVKAA